MWQCDILFRDPKATIIAGLSGIDVLSEGEKQL